MNDMMAIPPDLGETIGIGDRQALLLPQGYSLAEGRWALVPLADGLRLVPYVEADWTWANRLGTIFDEDFARSVEQGRIGPDHPDNALDDEPTFD